MVDMLMLALQVLKDWRVIFILILSIVFIAIANYVVRYRKKPPASKKQKAAAAAPAPAPAEQNQEQATAEASE